ncbi:MltA domain-containing protein [Asaia siamensis]|uniref:peptidoglycan lytic exotransglycosylase n=1 Tax=Asaia siamensis TaxID=110479 RepID=A0ABQ1LCW3_9PROT|nr:MltA domain-containing protein [Asaia siamensis]GBR08370.1 membrane-bound lytic murein transglycosylase [Asaia siamensis NRIC 0323]GGC22934.1 murein transglycosylase [Asaia siamensis]
MNIVSRLSLGLSLALLSSCAEPQSEAPLQLTPLTYAMLDGWSAESPETLLPQLRTECQRLMRLPPETHLGGAAGTIPNGSIAGEWHGACTALQSVENTRDAARRYFEQWFAPYLVSNDALFTGYYEPQIYASSVRTEAFQTPLYEQPNDLIHTRDTAGDWVTGRWEGGKFVPYYTRAEIDHGALSGRGLEIAWLRSPEDLFFLQIQGSGRLVMTDGSVRRVGFAAKNGAPYVPIGRVLVRNGEMAAEDVSLQSLKNWLAAHPDRAQDVMEQNPDYVFFKRVDTIPLDRGAPGAMGVPLTPGRSVAIDRSLLPMGAPIWVDTHLPEANGGEGHWMHLTFGQDVGSDIKGADHADLFTGWGEDAERLAGKMRSHGRMIVLLPHPPA